MTLASGPGGRREERMRCRRGASEILNRDSCLEDFYCKGE